MTVLEAIQSNPMLADFSVDNINFALSNRSVNGSVAYDATSSLKNVELVTADLYADLVLFPKYKEGQLSVERDVSVLKARALAIYTKYEDAKIADLQPTPINVGITAVNDA